jgi:predicted adenine nucleotide alpha hydrolase (AANH) superfamily ATPase
MALYRQSYCGCLFSALERAERRSDRAIEKSKR